MIAGLQGTHAQSKDGAHARSRGQACLGAFKCGEPVLEHRDGGIGKSRVNESLALGLETFRSLCCTLEDEAGGQEQRLGVLAEFGARGARTHR